MMQLQWFFRTAFLKVLHIFISQNQWVQLGMELLQEIAFMGIFLTLNEVSVEVAGDSGCEEPRVHIYQLVPHTGNLHSMT